MFAACLAAVTLAALFLNPDYRIGVLGAAVWFALGIAWFAVHARHRLILSPEEEFALSLNAAPEPAAEEPAA